MDAPARHAVEAALARRATLRAYVWILGLAVFAALFLAASAATGFGPERLLQGLPRTLGFFEAATPDLNGAVLFEGEETAGSLAHWFYASDIWLALVWQSVEMAILATLMGASAAFVLAFAAARATEPGAVTGFAVRRVLEIFRTIPDIVLALIFVFAFGIGPLAGVLAIAIHTTGALGKLFSEVVETIDARPIEGVTAAGGGLLARIRYGVVPQVLPNFASYALLRFEINVGAAAAIGFVGAGGIGEEFTAAISFGQFTDAAAIMIMTIAVIFVIDLASEALRHRLIGDAR